MGTSRFALTSLTLGNRTSTNPVTLVRSRNLPSVLRTFRYSGMPLCGVREPTEHQQSTARPWLSDAEQRPPCACGVGVRYGANRLIREGLGVGNRCFVMLHVEPKACAKEAWVRFGRVWHTPRYAPRPTSRKTSNWCGVSGGVLCYAPAVPGRHESCAVCA